MNSRQICDLVVYVGFLVLVVWMVAQKSHTMTVRHDDDDDDGGQSWHHDEYTKAYSNKSQKVAAQLEQLRRTCQKVRRTRQKVRRTLYGTQITIVSHDSMIDHHDRHHEYSNNHSKSSWSWSFVTIIIMVTIILRHITQITIQPTTNVCFILTTCRQSDDLSSSQVYVLTQSIACYDLSSKRRLVVKSSVFAQIKCNIKYCV